MPSSSSLRAITSLSSTVNETASPCVPSRSVVSNVKIRMCQLSVASRRWSVGGYRFLRYAGFLLFLQECHHFAQLAADALDRLVARRFAHGQEVLAAGLVLVDPR